MLAVRCLFRNNPTIIRICTSSITKCHVQNIPLRTTINITNYSTAVKKEDIQECPLKVIYAGNLNKHILRVRVFSLMTSALGLLCQPILIPRAQELESIPAVCAIYSVLGFFTFVTPIFLHQITKKYVLKMEYNNNDRTYTAYTLNFFARHVKITFKPEDVEVPDIPGMFTSFVIRGQSVFVDLNLFSDPVHYSKLIGFDKPINLHVKTIEDNAVNNTKQSK